MRVTACAKMVVLFVALTLPSLLATSLLTLEDQHVRYQHVNGKMTVGDVSKQMEFHVFLTVYKMEDCLKVVGFVMPNENRNQGGFQDWYLMMPPEAESWSPDVKVILQDKSILDVETRTWHSWSAEAAVERCIPTTFEVSVSLDKEAQPRTLHVADLDPVVIPQQVEEQHVQQSKTVIVYSHIRGQVTSEKVLMLYTHMAYHHHLGVEEFWLYATGQQIDDLYVSQQLRDVLNYGMLKVMLWPDMFCKKHADCIDDDNFHNLKHQILVYNVARMVGARLRKQLLILDTDEFLVSNSSIAGLEEDLRLHAQVVLPRYDSFTCRGPSATPTPDISLIQQDPISFLDHFRTRHVVPHGLTVGKSLIDPTKIAVYGVHLGREAGSHTTLWQSQRTAYILHLVNLWVVRRCEDTSPVEQIPAWNRVAFALKPATTFFD